jgi:hypothetical protein
MAKIVKRTISWGASTAPDVQGYKIYWAVGAGGSVDYTSTFADVGNVTSVIIPDDVPTFPIVDDVVTIGVTAYDDVGNESDMTVVTDVPFDFTAPDAPTNVVVGTIL